MSRRALLGFVCAAGLASGLTASGRSESAAARQFSRPLAKDAKIQQAVNRLTFGARPGDAEAVRKLGLTKWLDRQLHPERIVENPVLADKLKYLDSLNMSSQELVRSFPTQQLVRAMVNGREPFPADPERRRMIRNLVARVEKNRGDAGSGVPDAPKLADLLTPPELRSLRTGTEQQRLAAIQSLPPEKVDDVIAALPAGMRQQLLMAAPPEL